MSLRTRTRCAFLYWLHKYLLHFHNVQCSFSSIISLFLISTHTKKSSSVMANVSGVEEAKFFSTYVPSQAYHHPLCCVCAVLKQPVWVMMRGERERDIRWREKRKRCNFFPVAYYTTTHSTTCYWTCLSLDCSTTNEEELTHFLMVRTERRDVSSFLIVFTEEIDMCVCTYDWEHQFPSWTGNTD